MSGRRIAAALALAIGVVALYRPTLASGFVDWDDPAYVVLNENVAQLAPETVRWAFTAFESANWHPLTWLSHALDGELWGLEARAHHRTSIVLHALNAVLLLVAATRLSGRFAAAFVTAALFAFHPLRVEAVSWISERKELLCTAFVLLTLLAWERYVRRGGVAPYAGALVLFTAALLAKPMAVSLPLLLLALDLWPFRRLGGGAPDRRVLVEKLPFFALSAASAVVTVVAQRLGGALRAGEAIPFAERLGNAVVALAAYPAKALWPDPLLPLYTHPHFLPGGLSGAKVFAAAALLLAAAGFLWWRRDHDPVLLFGAAGYVFTILPVLGLVQVGVQRGADRYTYLPLLPPLLAIAVWVEERIGERRAARRAAAAAAAIATFLLATISHRQQAVWHDSLALWNHVVAVEPASPIARLYLGNSLNKAGRREEALAETRRAVALRPGWAPARTALATRLGEHGDFEQAVIEYRAGLALSPDDSFARASLGNALLTLGKTGEAIVELESAAAAEPGNSTIQTALGKAYLALGRGTDAIAPFSSVLRASPRSPAAHNNLALAFLGAGRRAEGIEMLERALALDPAYAVARRNLELARAESSADSPPTPEPARPR